MGYVSGSGGAVRFDDSLDEVFRNRGHVRVLRALAGLPPSFPVSGREVARRAGVSHTTALSALDGLVDQGLVRVHRARGGDGYALEQCHVLNEALVGAFELERSIRGLAVEFLADAIRTQVPAVVAAYLFGSAAWGAMEPSSDVDLAVVCSARDRQEVASGLADVGDRFRARFGNQLAVLIKTIPGPFADLLARGAKAGEPRLWDRILSEGIPVVFPPGVGDRRHA
jgi:predicted nucleotidyltransferase/biotin operon repressor